MSLKSDQLELEFSLYQKFIFIKVRKRAKIRNRYNMVPHLTQDTNGESNKLTIRHHKREPRGQPFSQQVTMRQQ